MHCTEWLANVITKLMWSYTVLLVGLDRLAQGEGLLTCSSLSTSWSFWSFQKRSSSVVSLRSEVNCPVSLSCFWSCDREESNLSCSTDNILLDESERSCHSNWTCQGVWSDRTYIHPTMIDNHTYSMLFHPLHVTFQIMSVPEMEGASNYKLHYGHNTFSLQTLSLLLAFLLCPRVSVIRDSCFAVSHSPTASSTVQIGSSVA